MKKRLSVDLDGIVVDYITEFAKELARRHNPDLQLKDLKDDAYVEREFGITRAQMNQVLEDHVKGGILEVIHPIPGAIQYLKQLKDEGYKITYVTSRREDAREQTNEWLKRHSVENKLVIVQGDKSIVNGNNTDFFIDDDHRYHRQILDERVDKLMLDQPYNKNYHGAKRFFDWEGIYTYIINENERMDALLGCLI